MALHHKQVAPSPDIQSLIQMQKERAMQAQLDLRFQEIALLTAELDRNRMSLRRMQESTSWRVTSPLRRLGKLLRKLRMY